MKSDLRHSIAIASLLVLSAAWKLTFILKGVVPFNADEAVVALMARHIVQGARPVFFYGQAYMGSLDAWLVAGGFVLFGEQVWVIRLIQTLLYLGVVWTTFLLGKAVFHSIRTGLLAGFLMAIPTVNLTLYSTASLGGYGEALLIGNLILLMTLEIGERLSVSQTRVSMWGRFGLLGFFVGLGFWANGLTLVYSVPAAFFLLWLLTEHRHGSGWVGYCLSALAGFLIGALPWVVYALQIGPDALMGELLGGAVAVEHQPWLNQVGSHLVNLVLLGLPALFGFRPPWEVRWLALPFLPIVLAFWLGVIGWLIRTLSKPGPNRPIFGLLVGVTFSVIFGFLFTPFGIDPSGRYFLPLSTPLAIFAAGLAQKISTRGVWQGAIIGFVVVYQAWGTIDCASRFPPGLTTQFFAPSLIDHRYDAELVRFLEKRGETRGYTNYWVSYPLAFLSGERLVFLPALPYHPDMSYTPRDNRYPPYNEMVNSSSRTAYITSKFEAFDNLLRTRFSGLGVTWQETQIGDYHIFYQLSRPVRPEELKMGSALGK